MILERLSRQLVLFRAVWIALFLLFVFTNLILQIALFRQPLWQVLDYKNIQPLQAMGFSLESYKIFHSILLLPIPVIWSMLGLLIFIRKPRDFGAMVIAIIMVGLGTLGTIPLWQAFAFAYPQWKWAILPMAFIGNICIYSFFFIFPTGRYVPRWTFVLAVLLSFYNILNSYEFALPPAGIALGKSLETIFPVFFIAVLGNFIFIPIYRFRYVSSPIERIQIRWVVFTIAIAMVLFAASAATIFFLPNNNPETDISFITVVVQPVIWSSTFVMIAISIAISILRYHLFDIDYLIRRTLVYSLLTGLLGLVYFGGVALLQGVLNIGESAVGGPPSTVVIVLTTLSIAALFNPLRRRLQDFIDQRFYRQKYDAEKALAEFAAVTRSETNLPALASSMMNVVQETVQPEDVKLWLKTAKPGG